MISSDQTSFESWAFDVSALMILISETDEQEYRLAGRSLIEAFAAAPVSGVQNYLRSYDMLLNHSHLSYFSPYGCKTAPLRNMKLHNLIVQKSLLKDHKFTLLKVPSRKPARSFVVEARLWGWVIFTWVAFLSTLVGFITSGKITRIGLVSCSGLVLWSIILRTIEHFNIQPCFVPTKDISGPHRPGAAIFLGRSNSGIILEGNREDVKSWTSCGLVYKDTCLLPPVFWQCFTRGGTFLVLAATFAIIPNGSTMDQLMFILVNILAQANTLVGRWLNASCVFQQLDFPPDQQQYMPTRTHVYAQILRHFKDVKDRSWVEKAACLPQTPVWEEWKDSILAGSEADPKELYDEISGR
ncbi:hypothetical protein HG530_003938 [Fusarium avenaceum]|nr:hypothetical protein HG530_003938 [Fusarium avenaceum]